jgi:hypothetical protein
MVGAAMEDVLAGPLSVIGTALPSDALVAPKLG